MEEINETVNINNILFVSTMKGKEMHAELICVMLHSNISEWLKWEVIIAAKMNNSDKIAIIWGNL